MLLLIFKQQLVKLMLKSYFLSTSEAYYEVISGVTVALALIPEAIAFALFAHLAPFVGLFAAFFMCLITALIGGRPGMISGATGSTAVILAAQVMQYGTQYVFATVIISGLMQIVLGYCRIDKARKLFCKPLMLGFSNGLAIIILMAQIHTFKITYHGHSHWMHGHVLLVMLALVSCTIIFYCLCSHLHRKIPAALTGIAITTAIMLALNLHTLTVGQMAGAHNLHHIAVPHWQIPAHHVWLQGASIILPYAVMLAIVALSETLITQSIIDNMTNTTGHARRECIAQGIANAISGCFGTMGGCAMIGQSMINISAGAKARLSGIVAGIGLLLFMLIGWHAITQVPLAALVGVMLIVCYKTFDWQTWRYLQEKPFFDGLIVISVMATTILTNLAYAVTVGTVLSWLQHRFIKTN